MTFSNVKLILAREIRDQMRDRRTLFMIVVLPILLYPLLGMSFFQLSQFLQEQPSRVLVVWSQDLGDLPPLFENQQFAAKLFTDPERAGLLELHFAPDEPRGNIADKTDPLRRCPAAGAVGHNTTRRFIFRPNFAERLGHFQQAIEKRVRNPQGKNASAAQEDFLSMPKPEIIYTTANEKSQIAFTRLSEVLRQWTEMIGKENLEAGGLPIDTVRPFTLESSDVARDSGFRGAAVWAKILPVLLLLWALTGAFYPAIDLCAGEKERGTLETLLSSPAQRSEIVLGKLLTIMLFSMVTAVLNLVSVGVTVWVVTGPFQGFRAPAAAFGRLAIGGLGADLRLVQRIVPGIGGLRPKHQGRAILPDAVAAGDHAAGDLAHVAGRGIEFGQQPDPGHRRDAAFAELVGRQLSAGPAIFAGGDRRDAGRLHAGDPLGRRPVQFRVGAVPRKRAARLGVVAAAFAARSAGDAQRGRGRVLRDGYNLESTFFSVSRSCNPSDFGGFARMALVTQLAVILTPALLMTIVLTGSLRETLLLKLPNWRTIPAALMLAVFLHPVANVLQSAVTNCIR